MKFGKPNMKSATKGAVTVLGAGTGVALGRGTNDMYPEKRQTSGIAKIATAAIAIAAMSAVKSDDLLSCGVKGSLAGFGGEKVIAGVSDLLVDADVLTSKPDDTDGTKFLQRALDIDIPCLCGEKEPKTTGRFAASFPALNMADLDFPLQDKVYDAKPMFV